MIPPSTIGDDWCIATIGSIDDMQKAVLGTELDPLQFSLGSVRGTMAFGASDGILYSSGLVEGRVALSGVLSEDMVSIGLGIRLTPGSRQWLNEVHTGEIGVFQAGDEHQALYMPGSLYVCASLSGERLEEMAADMGLVLDAKQLGGSGISQRRVSGPALGALQSGFESVHSHGVVTAAPSVLGHHMLAQLIAALGRDPRLSPGGRKPVGHGRIVSRALDYIMAHLKTPLSNRAIARAACTSQATLHRAFLEVLDDPPQVVVRKLRLNRIRQDLASEAEAHCTVTMVANRWGVSELGRFAGQYRALFGELPSRTRSRALALQHRPDPGGPSPAA